MSATLDTTYYRSAMPSAYDYLHIGSDLSPFFRHALLHSFPFGGRFDYCEWGDWATMFCGVPE